MRASEPAEDQLRALEVPFGDSLAIIGPSGSGKTTALCARIARLRAAQPEATFLHLSHPKMLCGLAVEILARSGRTIRIVDDAGAELAFAKAAEPLLALDWDSLGSETLDPEVAGLRSPRRFLESAFRLIRKLRDAAVEPEVFLKRSLEGAADFYATPRNFAHPELILGTKERYRDSLDVTSGELARQYRREIDLAKILALLYARYLMLAADRGEMTARDAIAAALHELRASPSLAHTVREMYRHAFIDEAHEMTPAQHQLLSAIYGSELSGVTLSGDLTCATSTFRGAWPKEAFAATRHTVALRERYRPAPRHAGACVLQLHRAETQQDEAAFVADAVRARLDGGAAPNEIALIFRTVSDVHLYQEALLARNIPAAISGDVNIWSGRRALDALALLWNVWDPFRHDYLLRSLSGPATALSDSSVAILCTEPPDPQVPLLTVDDEPAPMQRSRRWDPRRDLRLGWNLLYGDQDALLDSIARERVARFRHLREGWVRAMNSLAFADFVRLVWSEGLAQAGPPGSARAAAQQLLLHQLHARLVGYAREHPDWSVGQILAHAEARAQSDLETDEPLPESGFVHLLDVDAARGRTFEYVVIPDARAGSFPRWYTPDAFLFSPKFGMIPKENVGDAHASRTAKFTYYIHRTKARDAYNNEERRAFYYALSRARRAALVTAWGRATRGVSAPEFFQELCTP
jgi:superfamily I DNA/RNA helicase